MHSKSLREATYSEEQRAAFYRDVPLFMTHFPHLYVFQRQAQMQQMQMEAQSGAGGQPGMQAVQAFFSSEEGQVKVSCSPYPRRDDVMT